MKKLFLFVLFLLILFIGAIVFIESHWLDNVSYINNVKTSARENVNSYLTHEKNQLISDVLDKLNYDPNYNKIDRK